MGSMCYQAKRQQNDFAGNVLVKQLSTSSSATATTVGSSISSNSAKCSSKVVHFAPKECEVIHSVPSLTDIPDTEKSQRYWTNTEYQEIRLGARFVTREIRKHESHSIALIDAAFCKSLLFSCSLKENEILDFFKDPPLDGTTCLAEWCSSSSGRGLEKYTSPKHRFERAEFAAEARSAVLRLANSEAITDEQVATFYQEYTRSASIYARLMGQADRIAAVEALNSSAEKPSSSGPRCSTAPMTKNMSIVAVDGGNRIETQKKSSPPSRMLVRQTSQRLLNVEQL